VKAGRPCHGKVEEKRGAFWLGGKALGTVGA